ncbi:Mut3p-like fungal specific transcription factor [Colletotrichum truncatum]|uniref:Mut3p-like fungal specific transcription factor n=1 Tax=Colletotrichum truncatum TaxID=5467 RepID=A0ACC3ZK19_COLTU
MSSSADSAGAAGLGGDVPEETQKKRIYSACLHCQSRKRRCDGGEPSCGLCTRLNVPCVYTQRRRRGPGKKQKPNLDTEPKLQAIESSLKRMPYLPVAEPETIVEEIPIDSQGNQGPIVRNSNGANQACSAGHQDTSTKPPQCAQNPSGVDGLTLSLKDLFTGGDVMATLHSIRNVIAGNIDSRPFERREFAQLPPAEYIIDLEQAVIEEVQLFCPTISRKSFSELISQQRADGLQNCAANPARWVTINALFSIAFRWRATNDSFEKVSAMGWGYFKNAFSVFPELLISNADISTCEAMLTIVTFFLGTADARTTLYVASSAIRTAQMVGLHRRESYSKLNREQARRYKRVCWVTHIIDTEMTVRYGIPPGFSLEHVSTELPDDESPVVNIFANYTEGQQPLCYVRKLAELSKIQSKIQKMFSTINAQHQVGPDHQTAVLALSSELDEWRNTLPEDSRPELTVVSSEREIEAHVVILHFIYFNALIKVHTNLARLKSVSSYSLTLCQNPNWETNQGHYPNVQQAYAKCTAAARATIDLLRVMPPQSFVHFWAMVHYPVSACLILLWSALEDPTDPEAQLNVRLIGQFVQYLAGLQEEGCDVRALLDGCSKFFKIAKYAVHTQRIIRLTRPLEEDENLKEQLETLRLKLSGVADWTHLAQGLLSNIPVLCAQARDVFSDILSAEQLEGGYGPLASDILKPHNHNFSFGPRAN